MLNKLRSHWIRRRAAPHGVLRRFHRNMPQHKVVFTAKRNARRRACARTLLNSRGVARNFCLRESKTYQILFTSSKAQQSKEIWPPRPVLPLRGQPATPLLWMQQVFQRFLFVLMAQQRVSENVIPISCSNNNTVYTHRYWLGLGNHNFSKLETYAVLLRCSTTPAAAA